MTSTAEKTITKDGSDKLRGGRGLDPGRSLSARRCLAILNYFAQVCPNLSVATRILSQRISKRTEGQMLGLRAR